ncbi:hypothetical protein TanjilG_21429 [Lupinus angustifolius]|uniref:Pentatricopeptide repeat-containing protein n=1 Tax=Lupinus angustifolius TaxID=3871 RepID=A0A4P1RNJ7_LUPAN|nr:hypothetical protein TanjilG_21429 [Lupinus angustifolius]
MERIMMKVQRLRYSPYNFPSFSHSWRNPNCFIHSLSSSPSHHSSLTDHRVLHRVLQRCKVSMDFKTVVGECDIAKKLFDKMSVRDVVTWNTLIGGYVKNSRFLDALRIFKGMLNAKVEPDGFTFASVITGCARLGALGNAKWVHALMAEKRIELNYILSAALIDMYAKCGRIDVSKQVFKDVKRDHVTHRKKELGEIAIAKISHAESGDFVLLSNMYCSLNNWSSAERVRQMMKKGGVHKKRGKSWIELGDSIHQFKAADQSHAEMKAIYRVLEDDQTPKSYWSLAFNYMPLVLIMPLLWL